MKYYIFLSLLFFTSNLKPQEIETAEFDRFDSLYKVITKEKEIRKSIIYDLYDSTTIRKLEMQQLSNAEMVKILTNPKLTEWLSLPSLFVKTGKFVKYKDRKPQIDNITVYVITIPKGAVVLDKSSSIKIIFDDNSIKEYFNEAPIKVWGESEQATIYFTVPKSDPLRTKSIKAFKFYCDKYNIEGDTDFRTEKIIKSMIQLVESKNYSF